MTQPHKAAELSIQRHLCAWMGDTYPNIHIMATMNENSRHMVSAGIDVGVTDLILDCRVDDMLHVFYLELKTKTGKLSLSQIKWKADTYDTRIASSNTHYQTCHGFSDAKKAIDKWIEMIYS